MVIGVKPFGMFGSGVGAVIGVRMGAGAIQGIYEPCYDTVGSNPFVGVRGPCFSRHPYFSGGSGGVGGKPESESPVGDKSASESLQKQSREFVNQIIEFMSRAAPWFSAINPEGSTQELIVRAFLAKHGDGHRSLDEVTEDIIKRFWHRLMFSPLEETQNGYFDEYSSYTSYDGEANLGVYKELSVREYLELGAKSMGAANGDEETPESKIESAMKKLAEIQTFYRDEFSRCDPPLHGKRLAHTVFRILHRDGWHGSPQLMEFAHEVAEHLPAIFGEERDFQKTFSLTVEGKPDAKLRTRVLFFARHRAQQLNGEDEYAVEPVTNRSSFPPPVPVVS